MKQIIYFIILIFNLSIYAQESNPQNKKVKYKLENILEDIIEINFYTSKGETNKLITFLSENDFIRSTQDKNEMTYFRLRSDETLDYTVRIGKENSEFNLIHSSNMLWNKKSMMKTKTALNSILELSEGMYSIKSKNVYDKSGVQSGFFNKFCYVYPPTKTILYIDYFFFFEKNSGKIYQTISVPTKQKNINRNSFFNPTSI